MRKKYITIYLVYILLGLSLGLWEIFKPVWLLERGLLIENLGMAFFVALIVAAVLSIVLRNKVMQKGIRKSIQIALIFRIITFIGIMIIKNKTMMIILSCLDLLISTLIIQWMYPLLTQIKKSNIFFGLKDNLYDLSTNIGTIIASVFTGMYLLKFTSYEICIFICVLLFIECFILLFKVDNEKIIVKEKNLTKEILKIKSSKDYIKYSISRRFQLYLILGFFMVLLTQNLGIEESIAGIFWAILQIIFNGLGILVSFNSDKINRIKFLKFANISSIVVLISALLSSNVIFSFVAIIWIDILSDFYSPMIDAPLTNEIPKKYQLHFGNLKHFLSYVSMGLAYCVAGFLIKFNYELIFLISIPFLLFQTQVGVRALKNCKNTIATGIKDNNKV